MLATTLYPQISFGADGKARDPGCNVPRGYDCATPGYERPVTLDEAIEISKKETTVYLYGKGIQSADVAARVMGQDDVGTAAIPAIAIPGLSMPPDTFYIVVLGHVVTHKVSGKPAEFYQTFINRGTIFVLTRQMHEKVSAVR